MLRRLMGATLALAVAHGPGIAVAMTAGQTATYPTRGLTRLEPARDGRWRPTGQPDNSFTRVGVIGGRALDPDTVPGGQNTKFSPYVAAASQVTRPAKPLPAAKHLSGWLSEPVNWMLMLTGVTMIGFALRGLLAARRRLTRLEQLEP